MLWRKAGGGFERWLLETARWAVSTTVALPQQSESTTGRVGRRVAVRPRVAIANPGRHTPNPKAKQALRFHHLTKPERPFIITDIRTAFTLVRCGRSPISFQLEENAAAFLGGGYFLRFKIPKTTVASSIRSVSTSIVVMRVTPLMQGNNLAVPYQQLHYSIHGFILCQ